jgi:hypothetical protein
MSTTTTTNVDPLLASWLGESGTSSTATHHSQANVTHTEPDETAIVPKRVSANTTHIDADTQLAMWMNDLDSDDESDDDDHENQNPILKPSQSNNTPTETAYECSASENQSQNSNTLTLQVRLERLAPQLNKLADSKTSKRDRCTAMETVTSCVFGSVANLDKWVARVYKSLIRHATLPDISTAPLNFAEATACLVVLAKPLLKRYTDSSERVRATAIDTLTGLLACVTKPSKWLQYVVPVVLYRVGQDQSQTTEGAEHVRMALAQQVFTIVEGHHAVVGPYLGEMCSSLVGMLGDSCGSITMLASKALARLASQFPQRIRANGMSLTKYVMPYLTHKHSNVRCGAVEAIHALIPCGAAEAIRDIAAFRESNVVDLREFYESKTRVNYFACLVKDRNSTVRIAFYNMMADWMLTLPERFDYETLMFPYFLAGLADVLPQVQQLVLDTIDRIGELYEQDNEEKLKDQLQYGAAADAKVLNITDETNGSGSSDDTVYRLPAPFTKRPRLGARLVVHRFVPRLMQGILGELDDWKLQTRAKSAALLRSLMVYDEDSITQHSAKLLQCFLRVCFDKTISSEIHDCMMLLGRFASVRSTLGFLVDTAEEMDVETPLDPNAVLTVFQTICNGHMTRTSSDSTNKVCQETAGYITDMLDIAKQYQWTAQCPASLFDQLQSLVE